MSQFGASGVYGQTAMQQVIALAAQSRLRPIFLLCMFIPALGFLAWADFDALQSVRLAGNPAPFVPLGLACDRSGAEWKLTWNPSAVPLARAAAAELLIEDGSRENRILLSPEQIRSGAILYSPFTADICFRLGAYDGEHRWVSETLRVLDSQLGPAMAHSGPGTVIVRATTLRGAFVRVAAQRTGWPYWPWRSESKLEITEISH